MFVFFFLLLAQIWFPDDDTTYWPHGSLVKLPWEIKFPWSEIAFVEWLFTGSGSTQINTLAVQSLGALVPVILDPQFWIIDGATLAFQNASRTNNGTYTLKITLMDIAGVNKISSSVLVIILGKKLVNFTRDMPDPES